MDDPYRVARVLEAHNIWRRGEDDDAKQISPEVLGLAFDAAVKMLRGARKQGDKT
ncbi:MAG: hypothetical protein H0X13_15570 [Ramlibacter sp.]|nr:hypothetical protein [Ramlibacter sp.]